MYPQELLALQDAEELGEEMRANDETQTLHAECPDDLGGWAAGRDDRPSENARIDDDPLHLRRRRVPLGAEVLQLGVRESKGLV